MWYETSRSAIVIVSSSFLAGIEDSGIIRNVPHCIGWRRSLCIIVSPMYVMILLSVVSGLAVGILHPFRRVESLSMRIPAFQRELARISVASQAIFVLIAVLAIAFSNLSMDAY